LAGLGKSDSGFSETRNPGFAKMIMPTPATSMPQNALNRLERLRQRPPAVSLRQTLRFLTGGFTQFSPNPHPMGQMPHQAVDRVHFSPGRKIFLSKSPDLIAVRRLFSS